MSYTGKILLVPFLLLLAGFTFYGCTSNNQPTETNKTPIAAGSVEKKNETEVTKATETTESSEKPATTSEVSKDYMKDKGIGPVKSITLGPLNEKMAAEGQKIYQAKCTSCHKPDRRFVGPAQKGVLERRSPEWVMNMILNPEQMIKEDPIAKQLLQEYNLSPMANQNLTQDEARKVLEYFRTL